MEYFLMNDQPFTCPYCGARCQPLADFSHTDARLLVQQCLRQECGFIGGEVDENL
jgi:hypothetical protein